MKTDAPGPFSCEIYLKSWQLGYRSGDTKLHIDNCFFCQPIVHGGTEEFSLSAADQAKKNIADRKRLGRRRFFARSAVAATVLGIAIFGAGRFLDKSTESAAPGGIVAEIAVDFGTLDGLYASYGRPRIESIISNGKTTQVTRTLRWIHARKHTSMYDLICGAAGSSDIEIQVFTYSVLHMMDRQALKSHLGLLQSSVRQIRNQEIRHEFDALLAEIESL